MAKEKIDLSKKLPMTTAFHLAHFMIYLREITNEEFDLTTYNNEQTSKNMDKRKELEKIGIDTLKLDPEKQPEETKYTNRYMTIYTKPEEGITIILDHQTGPYNCIASDRSTLTISAPTYQQINQYKRKILTEGRKASGIEKLVA